MQKNHLNIKDNNSNVKQQNYILNNNSIYTKELIYKPEIKSNQNSAYKAPIKKFMKFNHHNSDKIKARNLSQALFSLPND